MKSKILFILLIVFPVFLSGQKLKKITKSFPGEKTIRFEYTVLKKKNYIKQGIYREFYENGKIKEEREYDYNKRVGEWKEYSYHGELRRTRKYEKGKLIAEEKYGIWREIGNNGIPFYYDYDKKERIFPQIQAEVKYPRGEGIPALSGTVIIKIKLDQDCELVEMTIQKSLHPAFDNEAKMGIKKYLEKLKHFKDDCKGLEVGIPIIFSAE